MSILSFDIGIKNLAYCHITKEKKILDWGIINISCNKTCEHCNKNNEKCDKSATILLNNIYLCTCHSKLKMYKNLGKQKKIKSNNSIYNIGKKLIKN